MRVSKNSVKNPAVLVVLVTTACLLPFAGKAFHMDDPLFLWSAQHIQKDPLDFFGFSVNWYGTDMPMSEVTKNPPGACYLLALAAAAVGSSEVGLHITFLVPAVLMGLGVLQLAKRFCSRPLLAALATVLTPCFLVSSTSVMSDTLMLALWVWTLELWMRGLETHRHAPLLAAALLMALGGLVKYFAIALLPLVLVYTAVDRRRLGPWALFLLIPAAVWASYHGATNAMYGRGLLGDAAAYATADRWAREGNLLSRGFIGLAFTGGCLATVLFYAPLIWKKRILVAGTLFLVALVVGLSLVGRVGEFPTVESSGPRWGLVFNLALMVVAGISLLASACTDFVKRRDSKALLLLLWILGTFVFAAFVNWSVTARSILPMVPAAGILMMRRLDASAPMGRASWWAAVPLIPAAVVALAVAGADVSLANCGREAAQTIQKKYRHHPGQVWFQGHWGFQYYMEQAGFTPLDLRKLIVARGDLVVLPANNTNVHDLPAHRVTPRETLRFQPLPFLSIMSKKQDTGFYSSVWGPLPFQFGSVEPEEYAVYVIR